MAEKTAMIQNLKILLRYQMDEQVPEDVDLETFTYKGQSVKTHRLVRHLKQTRNQNSTQGPAQSKPTSGRASKSLGRRLTNLAKPITEQGPQKDLELLLLNASRHMNSYFAKRNVGGKLQVHASTGFTEKLTRALMLESKGDIIGAFGIVNNALNDVHGLVLQQHPDIFLRVFDIFGGKASGLMRSAQGLLAQMSKKVLGPEHPVTLARIIIMRLDDEVIKSFFWWRFNEMLRKSLGAEDSAAYRACIWRLSMKRRLQRSKEGLQDLDIMVGRSWITKPEALLWKGRLLASLGNTSEAEASLSEALVECYPPEMPNQVLAGDILDELKKLYMREVEPCAEPKEDLQGASEHSISDGSSDLTTRV